MLGSRHRCRSGHGDVCLCIVFVLFSFAVAAGKSCQSVQPFLPSILRQLEPFFDGIDASAFEASRRFYSAEDHEFNTTKFTVPGLLEYNFTAAKSLPMSSPDYPWSHPNIVKIVAVNGSIWLPGGHIPVSSDGFSFHRQACVCESLSCCHKGPGWSQTCSLCRRSHSQVPGALLKKVSVCRASLLHDILAVNAEEPLPNLELLITSGDFPLVRKRSSDGSILPLFRATGSKFAFDLVRVWPYCEDQLGRLGFCPCLSICPFAVHRQQVR